MGIEEEFFIFRPAPYEIKTGIRIRHSRLTLPGAGRHATYLRFNPANLAEIRLPAALIPQ